MSPNQATAIALLAAFAWGTGNVWPAPIEWSGFSLCA